MGKRSEEKDIALILNDTEFKMLAYEMYKIDTFPLGSLSRPTCSGNGICQKLKKIRYKKRKILNLSEKQVRDMIAFIIDEFLLNVHMMYDDIPIDWETFVTWEFIQINNLLKKLGRELLTRAKIEHFMRIKGFDTLLNLKHIDFNKTKVYYPGTYEDWTDFHLDPRKLKKYEKTLKEAEKSGDLPRKSKILNKIGAILNDQSEALKRFEDALDIDRQLGDISGILVNLHNVGVAYYAQGNYSEAVKRFEEALEISEKLEGTVGKAQFLNNIASICYDQGNYQRALELTKESLQIADQLANRQDRALRNWWIGLIYYTIEKMDNALHYLEKSLEYYHELRELNEVDHIQSIINRIKK